MCLLFSVLYAKWSLYEYALPCPGRTVDDGLASEDYHKLGLQCVHARGRGLTAGLHAGLDLDVHEEGDVEQREVVVDEVERKVPGRGVTRRH